MRKELENSLKIDSQKLKDMEKFLNSAVDSVGQERVENEPLKIEDPVDPKKPQPVEIVIEKESVNVQKKDQTVADEGSDISEGEKDELLDNLHEINKQFKPFRDNKPSDCVSDTRSVYTTTSSTASTIAPEVIKRRVKASLERRKHQEQLKRMRAKGEANATTRKRRENSDNIKTSTSAFWMGD